MIIDKNYCILASIDELKTIGILKRTDYFGIPRIYCKDWSVWGYSSEADLFVKLTRLDKEEIEVQQSIMIAKYK